MTTPVRPRVFLDVSIQNEPVGRLTIELFSDKAPRTCANFRQLCTGEHNGLSYAKSPFHRVIDEFMVQGGDIERGDGTGTISIYGGAFEDEDLGWREMDAVGLVCSANRGKDTNGSQFFITLEPCPHLNGKHTIFGRLVSGEDTLQRISKVDVDKNDRPRQPVLISRCGELEKRQTKAHAHANLERVSASIDQARGRQRDSHTSDEHMADVEEFRKQQRKRRQSDNVVDEGIRGRSRQRSRSRSNSQPLNSTSESEEETAAEKHQRKRSASPSRHANGHGRRRRSLPNQYRDHESAYGDGQRYRPPAHNDHYRDRDSEYRRGDGDRATRDHDRYRPRRDRDRKRYNANQETDRLGSSNEFGDNDPPVRFKGRGTMKYREPDRAW